jgi:hypothetical protein
MRVRSAETTIHAYQEVFPEGLRVVEGTEQAWEAQEEEE